MSDVTLRLTVAHHGDNEFYDLGEITHEVPPEALWEALKAEPDVTDCDDHERCYVVDRVTDQGIEDDREVTEERAAALLGRDLEQALKAARLDLAEVYDGLGSHTRAAQLREAAA
jgi:hypothetical protein